MRHSTAQASPASPAPPTSGQPAARLPATAPRRPGFRPDIEGLRAVALLAVLGFHASVPHLAGGYVGVDVFFVVSGYLITSLLLREALATGRIALGEFFARRARRLLPSAALVLVAVVPLGLWLVAPLRRTDLDHDVLAAALSVSNWRFVNEQTDYLAAGRDPSPLLHFWSLAVEEQFYLVWAPLVALLVLVAARRPRPARLVLLAVATAATTASFLLCLEWSRTSVSLAYLGTPSRVWQFGVGALLALLPWRRLKGPRPLRALCGWAGAVAILYACVRYDAATPYPGTAALLPTLGTAAVILAGAPDRDGTSHSARYSVGRVLALRAPRAVGRLSYNLYLWHWPVLVLAEARFGPLGWPVKLALTLAAVLPATAAMRWVERPLRGSAVVSELPRRGISLGVSSIVIPVVLALVAGTGTLHLLGTGGPVDLAGLPPGAATGGSLLVHSGGGALTGPVVPDPVQARNSFPPDRDCETAPAATVSPAHCLFGDTAGPHRIVLLGDSHAGQWFSTLLGVAAQRHWALQELVKQGCPLPRLTVTNPQLGRTYTECDTWRADTLARLRTGPKPDLIVVASLNDYTADQKALAAAWEQTLAPLRAIGAPIVYVKDTPVPGTDIPACVSGHPDHPDDCDFPRAQALLPDPLADAITAGREPGVRMIDLDPVLCPGTGRDCPAVRDRILLYRDSAHLTDVAAVVLTARVEKLLTDVLTPGPTAGQAWTPLFHDDFDGPAGSGPSSRLWTADTGTCYPGCPAAAWGTGEVETMTGSAANVHLDGRGALEIVPTRTAAGGWASGRIESRAADLAAPPGGVLRIEASMQLPDVSGPAAAGYWPAFWALGGSLRNGWTGWPGVGEWDVMESVNGRPSVFGTLHCGTVRGGPCQEPQGLGSGEQPCPGCGTGFHTYAVEVDRSVSPEQVRWYLDGREYHRVSAAGIDPAVWSRAVDHGMFLILDLAVGGGLPAAFGGQPTAATRPGHPLRIDSVTAEVRQG